MRDPKIFPVILAWTIHRVRLVCLALAALVAGAASAQTARVASPESIREVATTPGAAIARQALTAAESGATIDFEVVLKMKNFSELQRRAHGHERIARAEMREKYHPAAADYAAVVAWLKSEGLTIRQEDASHISVFGSGTVQQVSRAFQTTFARVSFEGREHSSATTAPTLPAGIAEAVLGVNGLQPHLAPHKHSRAVAPNPNSTTGNGPPYLPSQILKAYHGAGLAQNGAGETIAIVIDTFPRNSDLTAFWSACGVQQSLANIQQVQVVAGTLPAPSGEETLDVEWSSSMAPGAKVRIYATLDLGFAHLDQAYSQIYNDLPSQPTLHQVSMSYGLGELYNSTSQMQTDEQYFAALASAGVTIFVSSGDGGSNPTSTGASGGATPTPESPSNSPSVTSVGGTSLYVDATTGAETSESTWSGSGGGVSTYFARPAWQTGAGLPAGAMRAVPDVSLPADPNTGALVILNGANVQYGGTSWSAPAWAGLCALINQSRSSASLPPLGLLGPKIYPLLGTGAFRDITTGSNGVYSAGAGYDLCTGLGVPEVATLVQVLTNAPTVTTPPLTQFVPPGSGAIFSIVANGGAPLAYQWQREAAGATAWTSLANDATFSGTATATLTLAAATAGMNGDQFRCVVSNSFGSATSGSAPLLVGTPPAPLIVSTLAGAPAVAGTADGTGSAARFQYPGGIALDPAGNIVVADTNNQTIRKVTPAGVTTTFAGAAGIAGSTNATGSAARFSSPSNVAVDSAGNIFVADASNQLIRKISPSGSVSTLAGRAGRTGSTNATGGNARFNNPLGVAVDGSGNVFVADANNHLIRKITSGGVVTTFVGGAGVSGSADGTGTAARFNSPTDVALDASGNLFVADAGNHLIRKITSAGVVTTIAGSAGVSGSSDGIGASARFNSPSGVRCDGAGNIFVADTNSHTVRRVTPGGIVTTLAGSAGASGTADGIGAAAFFNYPSNALPDAAGNIYVIDTYNHTLRIGTPSTAPVFNALIADKVVAPGQGTSFTSSVTANPAPTFQWQRLPVGGAAWTTLADGGAYSGTATSALAVSGATLAMSGDEFRCIVSNVAGTTTSANAGTLRVGIAPQLTGALSASWLVGQSASFTLQASGTPAPTFSTAGLPAWASLDPNTGVLSGTPPQFSGGSFSFIITISNGIPPASAQAFVLAVRNTFANWQTGAFGASAPDASVAGPNADPNHNGIPNLIEYALGTDPLGASSTARLPVVALTVNPADGKLHLTLTAQLDPAATDLAVTAEVTSDLQTWQSGPGNVEVAGDTTVAGVRTLTLRDTAPAGSEPRFIRLRVTKP